MSTKRKGNMDIKKEISDDEYELMDETEHDTRTKSVVCKIENEDTFGEIDKFDKTVENQDFSSTRTDLFGNTSSLKIVNAFTLQNKEACEENENIVNVSDKSKEVSMIGECSDVEVDQQVDTGHIRLSDTVTKNNHSSKLSSALDMKDNDEEDDCIYISDDMDTIETEKSKKIDRGNKTKQAKTFVCKLCNKAFTSEGVLKRHKLQFHSGGPAIAVRKGKYQCQMCHKTFGSPSELSKPTRTQTGERQQKCKLCVMKCTVRIQNMTSPVRGLNDLSINGTSGNSESHRRLKPGKKKSVKNEEEKIKNELQALRMQKSRLLKRLRKIALKFQNQIYEPVETLFIIYEKNKNLFKYYGSGDIVEKFERGEVIMKDPKRRSKMSAHIEPQALVPRKYNIPFTCGPVDNLAVAQGKELLNFTVSLNDSRELSININPGPNGREQQKDKDSLFPIRFKRLPTNTRGRGRGRREKNTLFRERTPISSDNEDVEREPAMNNLSADDSFQNEERIEHAVGKRQPSLRGMARSRAKSTGRGKMNTPVSSDTETDDIVEHSWGKSVRIVTTSGKGNDRDRRRFSEGKACQTDDTLLTSSDSEW